MRKVFLLILLSCSCAYAQIPPGYYNTAQGLSGTPLRQALHDIIDNHNPISYNALWNAFPDTDQKPNGKVWDMYSDIPSGTPPYQFTFGSDQCGSYSNEGDCYNREHVWPQSVFNSASPMVSDLFHIYPTDGKVNGIRSNYAFGYAGGTIYNTTMNGSKLGTCSNCFGFSGVVFEPIDAYKGDIARSIFYMSTRYYTEDASWNIGSFSNKAELYPWAISILIAWHHLDPVSQKETDRNNEVYAIQDNRNPYIDHPEWADSVFASYAIGLKGVKDNSTELSVFPNPNKDSFSLTVPDNEPFTLSIFNSQGTIIYNEQKNGTQITIGHEMPPGIYTLQLMTASGKSYRSKFIVAASW